MTMALEGGDGSASRSGRSLPPGKTRYPLYRRLGGPQGQSGQVRKISPPLGFDPRTVQPVASRYTNHATRSMQSTELWFKSWVFCGVHRALNSNCRGLIGNLQWPIMFHYSSYRQHQAPILSVQKSITD